MKPTTSTSKAKQYPKIEGFKTNGVQLSQEEIISSIRLYCNSMKCDNDLDLLVKDMGFDIVDAAEKLVFGHEQDLVEYLKIRIVESSDKAQPLKIPELKKEDKSSSLSENNDK